MTAGAAPTRAKVLFICTGDICRAPTAEGVFRSLVEEARLAHCIEVDSAGTHGYHAGEAPDFRAQAAAARRGYDLSALRARQVTHDDCIAFDYLLAMDEITLAAMRKLCPSAQCDKVQLFGAYCEGEMRGVSIPDPYYGCPDDFERVLDITENAAQHLLRHMRSILKSG